MNVQLLQTLTVAALTATATSDKASELHNVVRILAKPLERFQRFTKDVNVPYKNSRIRLVTVDVLCPHCNDYIGIANCVEGFKATEPAKISDGKNEDSNIYECGKCGKKSKVDLDIFN